MEWNIIIDNFDTEIIKVIRKNKFDVLYQMASEMPFFHFVLMHNVHG